MIDASGVVGAGVIKGNFQLMGDFDECLEVDVKMESNQTLKGFTGQYCTLDLPLKALIETQSQNTSVNILFIDLIFSAINYRDSHGSRF